METFTGLLGIESIDDKENIILKYFTDYKELDLPNYSAIHTKFYSIPLGSNYSKNYSNLLKIMIIYNKKINFVDIDSSRFDMVPLIKLDEPDKYDIISQTINDLELKVSKTVRRYNELSARLQKDAKQKTYYAVGATVVFWSLICFYLTFM